MANRLGSNSLIDLIVFGRAPLFARRSWSSPARPCPNCRRTAPTLRWRGWTVFATPMVNVDRRVARKMQRAMQTHCAVYRTGEVLARVAQIDAVWRERGRKSHGPLADLELRSDRDAGVRQSDRPAAVTIESAANARNRAAPTPRGFFRARRRNWMKHTLATIDTERRRWRSIIARCILIR